ncbi:glycoside hydrolase family 55 protein [Stemphylium lycopersici]|uniref:Glycoside hydrolase family 55 protein n=1 Tax=Stemphylium lycopersici TaxID=183478 RepID=A0A364N1K5_STELY|nr:glycoside hydrolase family 55 protein [Stemphylium lycopersici]RAR08892.1 glycoside hydrolase family 55 protein [Stemphylium lycopersici]
MFVSTTSVVLGLYSTCALALNVRYNSGYAHESSNLPSLAERRTHPHVKSRQYDTQNSTCAPYWMEDIKHQGVASFNPNPDNYTVFRNVKSYGAVGDGVTDDTAAIQKAMTEGNRCGPSACESSTNTPAVLYFPGGTYLISSSIIDYYYTQIIGNPNCLPTILAASNFSSTGGLGLIDGSPYLGTGTRPGRTGFGPTNTFFRQIRNLILDTTQLPANFSATGIHWPTAQTTSIQNVVFNMNAQPGTLHEGLFIEEGSGGFMTDLVFNGGNRGFRVGNQQFTTRNLTFNNVDTAIEQLWDWGWTYKSVSINNCRVGVNATAGGPSAVNVGSITFFDSEINNTPIGIITSRTDNSEPAGAAALYLENVKLDNVKTAVLGPNGTYLAGSSGPSVIDAWADGHRYLPEGPIQARGHIEATKRPQSLVDAQGKYYERSKPQYGDVPLSQFLSARDLGVTGDGHTDDTFALNAAILKAKAEGKILYLDAGFYKVTSTIYVPPGSIIVGEALASVILSSGPFFNSMALPQPVVKIALPGEQGRVEISDLFVSTQGQQAGAILYEYNLGTYEGEPAGLWDVHTRIGGFAGSDLQTEQCEKTPDVKITESNLSEECIAAYMSWHVTKFAAGIYMENNWLWTADHDLDDARNNNTQITIYAGRGLLIESINGRIWLYGTAVEHHVLYEYQFVDTHDIFMGQIQTETAYYQPNPDALIPFPENPALSDPVFTSTPSSSSSSSPSLSLSLTTPLINVTATLDPTTNATTNSTTPSSPNTASGWGLRIVRSNNILGYGVGLYSFFDNYSTDCSQVGAGAVCQSRIISIEGDRNTYDISLYNLNTVGSTEMITRDGVDLASNVDNNSTFVDTINIFRIDSFGM